MPDPSAVPPGCAFHERCRYAVERCSVERPPLVRAGTDGSRGDHDVACHRAAELDLASELPSDAIGWLSRAERNRRMIRYIARRLVAFIPTVFLISVVVYIVIQLPPGSWIDTYVSQLESTGQKVDAQLIEALKVRYGVGEPIYVGYFKWVSGWFRLDFGRSFLWGMPALDLIKGQIGFTVVLSLATLLFAYLIAIPIATYAATHQYSLGDNIATLLGFVGLSVPNFMLAFILMYVFYKAFGISPGGLLSPEFQDVPWSLAKLADFLRHLWIPMIVVGTSGTASTIRVLRATLLDELGKDYIKVARSKGVRERRVIFRHALPIAINPIVSRIIWELPEHHLGFHDHGDRAQPAGARRHPARQPAEPGHVRRRDHHPLPEHARGGRIAAVRRAPGHPGSADPVPAVGRR